MHTGETIEKAYLAGETCHEVYKKGQYKIHDLENIGDAELVFTTVEFLDCSNQALLIPERVRRGTTS